MDSISHKLCRLCLESSDGMLDIFENTENPTIASILTKHFWFQVDKDDGMPEWLCDICWIQTKTFHHFYRRVEIRHSKYHSSNDSFTINSIKQERSESPTEQRIDPESHPDLNLVKEEVFVTLAQIPDQFDINEENCDDNTILASYNDDGNSSDESDNAQTSNDDDQPFNKKSKSCDRNTKNISAIQVKASPVNTDPLDSNSLRRQKKAQQDAQIREFFTMKCEICSGNIQFETLTKARDHYRNVHNKSGYLMCCGNKFHRRYIILDHIRFHINPDAYRCDLCDRNFKDRHALKIHIGNHVPLHLRAHKCSLCNSSFTKAASLKFHVQNIHSDEMVTCEKCSKTFRSPISLASHIRKVHEFSLEHVCETCARRFKTKTILLNHIACEHSTTPQPKVQCNICGLWLKHNSSLRKHLKRHQHAKKYEPVKCPVCDKEVKSLKSHIQFVHGERHFQCHLCDKAFKTAIILKEHVAWHTNEFLYTCRYCEKKFKSNANMYAHGKRAHVAEWSRDQDISQRSTLSNKPTV